MDRETIINMAITAGLDCYANNADKKMDEPLDEMESNYVNKLALFASFVYQYAYAKRDNEALTKNLVAMWTHPTWVGPTKEDCDVMRTAMVFINLLNLKNCILDDLQPAKEEVLSLLADRLKQSRLTEKNT